MIDFAHGIGSLRTACGWKRAFIIFSYFALPITTFAESAQSLPLAAVQQIDAAVEAWRADSKAPALSIAVVANNELIWSKGYGAGRSGKKSAGAKRHRLSVGLAHEIADCDCGDAVGGKREDGLFSLPKESLPFV